MKCLLVVAFSLCLLQVSGFYMNHTCYTIRNGTLNKTLKPCLDCFKKAYPEEPEHIDKLGESAQTCVKLLPKNFHTCLSQEKDQKDCIEAVARKHFRAMRKNFWKHYDKSLTKEEKCQYHQYIGIMWYMIDIRGHSQSDWKKVHDVTDSCRTSLLDNYKLGKRDADEDKNEISKKEAATEENEMEEADRLRHNIGLTQKFTKCLLEEIKKNEECKKIFVAAIDKNCHNVPLVVVKTFYNLKAKE